MKSMTPKQFHASHAVPERLPAPPSEWTAQYLRMQADERFRAGARGSG